MFHRNGVPDQKSLLQFTLSLELFVKQMWSTHLTEYLEVKRTRGNQHLHIVVCCSKTVSLHFCVALCGEVDHVPLFGCVPSLGFFFMPRIKSGFCLIRRHGCLRKCESQAAASSPQSTVSTLEEEERISFPGKIYSLMLPIWSNI